MTINHDIQGLFKIILKGNSYPSFNYGPIFSLFRDICIIIYESNKVLKKDGAITDNLSLINNITEIRHKVKTNQGMKNKDIFHNLLEGHRSIFGNDIDNIGFYIDGQVLASSTLFLSFVFAGTPLQNFSDKENFMSIVTKIGKITSEINQIINESILLTSNPLLPPQQESYILKDVWDQRFFKKEVTYNVFITRLLLIQNELTTCVWLKRHLDYDSPGLNLDKYTLLRLISIKLHETMRNLFDIKQRFKEYWNSLENMDYITDVYKNTIQEEVKTLRDMLHYSNEGVNFFDYLQQKLKDDSKYSDILIDTIFDNFIYTIRESISNKIDIHSYESMSDTEKISRRIQSRAQNNFQY